jgi:hypothetical protein
MPSYPTVASQDAPLRAMNAARLLVIGGIALICAGMILGDIFAVFVLHQNAGRIGETLITAAQAVAQRNPADVSSHFENIGSLLENRGTKVDAHVHIIDFGYLALLLALIQPFVAFDERRKRVLARLFLSGAILLPVSVFLIHYTGLAYSPLQAIGWASIFADFGGLLVIIAVIGELAGLWLGLRKNQGRPRDAGQAISASAEPGGTARALLAGGTLLVLAGFIHGAIYSATGLYSNEQRDLATLTNIVDAAAANDLPGAAAAVSDNGQVQADKAVNIAAHSHIIEFGFLAILLSFFQKYVFLSQTWKRRWAITMLAGSVILPVFVLLELKLGLLAGGIADAGGLLVVIALIAMLSGVVRYTGRTDAEAGATR